MTKPKKKNIKNKKKKLSDQRKNRKNIWFQIILISGIIATIIILSIKPDLKNNSQKNSNRQSEIKFKKEGELTFYKSQSNQEITTIDIEIADDNFERAKGLMYRFTMSDSVGMFFIMEREEPQSFWMKSTYISLDIIYLNKELEIVKIQKYTQPLSEEFIPSIEKSKYVIEVIGGFCDLHMIQEGDYVEYER